MRQAAQIKGHYGTGGVIALIPANTLLPDAVGAAETARYAVKTWTVKRTSNYGGPHTDEQTLPVARAEVLADVRTIRLTIPGWRPTWGIEIGCRMRDANGRDVERVLAGTIH